MTARRTFSTYALLLSACLGGAAIEAEGAPAKALAPLQGFYFNRAVAAGKLAELLEAQQPIVAEAAA
jgi:hypothetical protein